LPWVLTNIFHVSNTAPEGFIPPSVKWAFYLGGLVFLLTIIWTVFKSKEYSPEELENFHKDESDSQIGEIKVPYSKLLKFGMIFSVLGAIFVLALIQSELDKSLYVLAGGILFVGLLFILSAFLQKDEKNNAFTQITSDLLSMPKTMKQLAWVQFFTWFALFSMWIYATQAVTHHIYHSSDTTSKLYNEGADWVGVLFTVYNGVAAIIAFMLPVLAKRTSRKFTHFIALLLGGLGLISFYFITNPNLLIISMIGVGIAWASILSMPYAILSGSLPAKKMGYFMGVFNFFIVIPQLIAATILGFLVKGLFNGDPVYALIVGGVSMFIAGLLTLRVDDNK
jgi:maltose/moltooligosaccharide transporter